VDVHEEVAERDRVELLEAGRPQLRRAHAHARHPARQRLFGVEHERRRGREQARIVRRLARQVAVQLEPQSRQPERKPLDLDRRATQQFPFRVGR
jgi:hypothetical protein